MSDCRCQAYIDDLKLAAREDVTRHLMLQVSELEGEKVRLEQVIENLKQQIQILQGARHGRQSVNP